jgi:hypothetical protein
MSAKCTNKYHSEIREVRLDSQNKLMQSRRSQGKQNIACRCRPTRRFSFNLAYDRMVFNGLLFICDMRHVQKMNTAPMSRSPLETRKLKGRGSAQEPS